MIDSKKPKKKRKPGRPWGSRTTFIGKAIGLRLYPDMEARLEAWISRQGERGLSLPEAIRRLLDRALTLEEELMGRKLEKLLAAEPSPPAKPTKSRRPAKRKGELQ
jgi:hypothetical protein